MFISLDKHKSQYFEGLLTHLKKKRENQMYCDAINLPRYTENVLLTFKDFS
jgi:hypothetical protein